MPFADHRAEQQSVAGNRRSCRHSRRFTTSIASIGECERFRRTRWMPRPTPCASRERRFADSLLEETGFEPLVPLKPTTETLFRTPRRIPGCTAPEDGSAENGYARDASRDWLADAAQRRHRYFLLAVDGRCLINSAVPPTRSPRKVPGLCCRVVAVPELELCAVAGAAE